MGKPDLTWTSLALTILIAIVASALAAHLWWDRGRRGSGVTDVDRRHFLLQDARRAAGIVLMALLATGIYVGSRLPTRVVVSAEDADANRRFIAVWFAVLAAVMLLLGLAVVDWIATRRYARRHREAMHQERIAILRDSVRRSRAAEDGHANGSTFPIS